MKQRNIAYFLGSIGSAVANFFGGQNFGSPSSGGKVSKNAPVINMETVFYLSAYWQAVDLIRGGLSGVSLDVVTEKGEVADQHPVQNLLKNGVSGKKKLYDSVDFVRLMATHTKTAGNFYSLVNYDRSGSIEDLMFLSPTGTIPYLKNGRLEFHVMVDAQAAKYVPVPMERIFHAKGMTMDGINGISPLGACYPTLQLALSSILYGLNFFANDARPSTVLTSDRPLTKAQANEVVDEWVKNNSGVNNRGVTVLPAKFNVHTLNVPPDESQSIAARQESVRDVARITNVPSVLLNDMEASTYNNVREAYNALDNNVLVPMADGLVSSMRRQLIDDERYSVRFDWENHFTAPQGERYRAYSVATGGQPFALVNEVRKMEGLRELTPEELNALQVLASMGNFSAPGGGNDQNQGEEEDAGQQIEE